MTLVYRIIVSIVAVLFVSLLIQPLLVPVVPPFGLVVVILLYIGILFYLLNPTVA